MRSLLFGLFLLPALLCAQDPGAALRRGIATLPRCGVPGPVAAFGPKATVIWTAPSHKVALPLIAVTTAGKGRVAVLGHGGYAGQAQGDLRVLQENLMTWLAQGEPKELVFLGRGAEGLRALAREKSWPTSRRREGFAKCAKGTVLVLLGGRADGAWAEDVRAAVRRGAGLVAFGPGWGWLQLNPGKTLARDHVVNRVLRPFGVAIADGHLEKPDPIAALTGARLAMAQASQAFARLRLHVGRGPAHDPRVGEGRVKLDRDSLAQCSAAVESALGSLPLDPEIPFVHDVLAILGEGERAGPVRGKPVTQQQPLRRLGQRLAHRRRQEQLPVQQAAAEAGDFPGAVPQGAPRLARAVREIDLSIPGWHGVGLYAPPGEPVVLTVPESHAKAGLALRVGCHKDRLWHKPKWDRVPDITVELPVRHIETRLAGAFGGLVYVVVPNGTKGKIEVAIGGAVAAPRYVAGVTKPEEWRSARACLAPWAELENGKVTLTVPSEMIRELDDPAALMKHWDAALDCYAELGSRPLAKRPQRIVADRQISAGYMHSGYPIMTHLDAAPRMVDLQHLTTKGDWGLWHELGHNHQVKDWTFGGTGEVTCNLFSLFLMERFTGLAPKDDVRLAKQRPFIVRYRKAGAPFAQWKSKPFLALYMYMELQREFGWEAYRKVFAEYRDLPAAERPKTDAERRDQWMTRFSKTVGRNLGPFFESWGVPTSKGARDAVVDLPGWMPTEPYGR